MTKKLFTTVAASVALIATPVLAQSVAAERVGAPIGQAEQFGGGDGDDDGSGLIIGILAAAVAITGIIVALEGDNDDIPTSP